MKDKFTREEKSWMMYDWANSAHTIVIVTVLPIFFKSVFADNVMANAWWGSVTSAATLVIAVLAPFLGAIGDFMNMKKRLFTFFLSIGVISCLGLAGVPFFPSWQTILALYALSLVGFSGANLYYDGFLPEVTTNERMDRVSSWGFGLGYIGGSTIPFIIFLVLYTMLDASLAIAISFGITALWWGVFSIPMLKNVKQTHYVERQKGMIVDSFRMLFKTLREIKGKKTMFLFMLAYFFYIDGVNTIIHMSTVYGDSLGIDSTQMMLALLMVQILAFPFAILYGSLAKKFGARKMIGVGIIVYFLICLVGFYVSKAWHFWALAALVATSQGGIQALSRSLFGRMIPDKNRSNEFFGFFDIFGKFSAILGPMLFGWAGVWAKNAIVKSNPGLSQDVLTKMSTPYGVISVLLMFLIGGVLFVASSRAAKKTGEL